MLPLLLAFFVHRPARTPWALANSESAASLRVSAWRHHYARSNSPSTHPPRQGVEGTPAEMFSVQPRYAHVLCSFIDKTLERFSLVFSALWKKHLRNVQVGMFRDRRQFFLFGRVEIEEAPSLRRLFLSLTLNLGQVNPPHNAYARIFLLHHPSRSFADRGLARAPRSQGFTPTHHPHNIPQT